jgi:hypothetical protein
MPTPFDAADLTRFRGLNKMGNWTPGLAKLAMSARPFIPSRQVTKGLSDEIATEAARSSKRWGRLHDLVALLAVLTDGAVVDDYQLMHQLGPSRTGRSSLVGLGALYRRLRNTLSGFCPPATDLRLASFAAVTDLFVALRPVRQEYEWRVRGLRPNELMLVLAAPGLAFSSMLLNPEAHALRRFASPRDDAAPEEIATGASYTLTTFNRLVGLDERSLQAVRGEVPEPGPTQDLIRQATALFSFDEAEVEVFRAGYTCAERAAGTWRVTAPSEALGRALELGHIDSAQQNFLRRFKAERPTRPPALFSDVARDFSNVFESSFQLFPGPPRRVRLALGAAVAKAVGGQLLLNDELYLDEMHWLVETCYELAARPDELRSVPITPHLTLWNVIQVSRVFRLLCVGWLDAMERLGDDINAKLNSSIQLNATKSTVDLICSFGFSREMASEYVGLFTWDTSARSSYADLQYRPFLRIGDNLAISIGVHERSNLLRNALIAQQRRLSSGTLPDVVTDTMVATIRENHQLVATGAKFRFRGEESDLDVAWRLGDTLFVFECKNTIAPCSSFEMRATLDQLDKGAKQLSRLERLWSETAFRRHLEERLGFSLHGVTQLRTAIVLSHRVYAGAHYKGHPVRHLHALCTFIRSGEVALVIAGPGAREHVIHHWAGAALQAADLERHLDADSPSYAARFASQVEEAEVREIGGVRVERMRYPLDMNLLVATLGAPPDFADGTP